MPAAVIETVQAEVLLLEGGTVITATHRLARQLRQRHDRARAAAGARAWPTADVLPLDAWLRRTWETAALGDSAPGKRRLLSDDECRLVWRRVLANDGQDRLDAGVIVPLVSAAWRLCQAWEIPLNELGSAAESEDGRMFAVWAEAYVAELERHGWLDSGGFLRALGLTTREDWSGGERPTGFAGFDPWTPALAAVADSLDRAGITVFRIAQPRRRSARNLVAARDETDELVRAFAWAGGHAAASGELPVAIVLPGLERTAGTARRVGLDLLSPGWQLREPGVRPVALSIGRQLADYPIICCALNLLQLLAAPIPFDNASLLLRSPYLAGADQERASRAGAELELRRQPIDRVGLPALFRLSALSGTKLISQWRGADGLAHAVRNQRLPPSRWAGHFAGWLAVAGWPGDRGLSSEEFQAAEAWQRALEAFAATDEVAGLLSLGAAGGLLAQLARDRPFEPESADGAVQVLSLAEAEGQDFQALWLCGLTADQWPPPARPHPLIPLALQRAAGIPEATPALLEAQTRGRFERLLAAAEHLVLSWPAEQDQAEALPSPLLAEMAIDGLPDAAVDGHPDRQLVAAGTVVEELPVDPPPAWRAGASVRGGARVLSMQSVCPARAFVEFRLRGAPLEAPARPLDPAARGKVVHTLLEHIYGIEQCSRGLGSVEPDVLQKLFAPLANQVLDELLPGEDPYLVRLRVLEKQRLWDLLLSLRALDIARPAFSVVTELAREVSMGPLSLNVRLDRLDKLADGGELVIDYKTGRFQPGDWKRQRLTECQLPLYAVSGRHRGVAVIQIRPPEARLRGVGDAALGISGIRPSPAFFGEAGLDWNAVLDRWQAQLGSLAAEFAAGDFRVNPADRKWGVGQFAGLTRIHDLPPAAESDELVDGDEE